MSRSKFLHSELVLLEKSHEMQQVERVSRKGVGRASTGTQMAHKARHGRNGVIIIIQEFKGKILPGTLLDTLDSHRSLAPSV